jgi:hypothetical protein
MTAEGNNRIFESSEFAAWAAAIRQKESTDNYSSDQNNGEHLGAYQLSPAALQDAGFQDRNGNWTALAQSFGVNSTSDFLASHNAQDLAFERFTAKNWQYLAQHRTYIGSTVDGIYITEPGLLAGAHLVGYRQVEEFLSTQGAVVPKDGSNPPVPVTSYLKRFSGYDFTYDEEAKSFVNTSDKIPFRPPVATPQQKQMALHARAVAIGKARANSFAPLRPRFLKRAPRGSMRPKAVPPPNFHANQSSHGTVGREQLGHSDGASNVEGSLSNLQLSPDAETVSHTETESVLHSEFLRSYTINAMQRRLPGHRFSAGQAAKLSLALGWRDRQSGIDLGLAAKIRMRLLGRSVTASRGYKPPLPSVAPIRRDDGTQLAAQQPAAHHAGDDLSAGGQRQASMARAEKNVDPWVLRSALEELLGHQARLPPSGATAFDPRVTPAWPGLQLPA